jgi:3-isopropylmalate dehydrogenase
VSAPSSRSYSIGVIPGDGIGPEVIAEGLKVLAAVASRCSFTYELVEYPWSSQLYLRRGELMPDSAIDEYRRLDAIYLGALGDPRVERGLIERSVLMKIRFALDLYINLRPIVLYAAHLTPLRDIGPEDLDLVVVRENTEDAYAGAGGIVRSGTPEEMAIAEMIFTRSGITRAVRYAFELARSRAKKNKVTLVDKSNAIRPQELWRRIFAEVAADYPEITTDELYVDAAAMHLVDDPGQFDVIVTTNLFGDILTDLGAVLQGGLGSAASGNIHPGKVSMFEPIHGSAPNIAGQGIASPVGAILALSMLLDYAGEHEAAGMIEDSVKGLLVSRRLPSLDGKSGFGTSQVGDMVVEHLERMAASA